MFLKKDEAKNGFFDCHCFSVAKVSKFCSTKVKEKKEGRFVFYSMVNPKTGFARNLLKTVESIPEKNFLNDTTQLKKRLLLRKNGKPAGSIFINKRCR